MCLFEGLPIELLLLVDGEDLVFFSGENLSQLGYAVLRLPQCHHFLFLLESARHHQKVLETDLRAGDFATLLLEEHLFRAEERSIKAASNTNTSCIIIRLILLLLRIRNVFPLLLLIFKPMTLLLYIIKVLEAAILHH